MKAHFLATKTLRHKEKEENNVKATNVGVFVTSWRDFPTDYLVPIPIVHIVFFNAEPLRTQRIAEKKAIDSAVLPARTLAGWRELCLPR